MRVALILATWNEIDGMLAILPRINRKWVDEILVIDGGSTDGTIEFAEKNGLRVLRQNVKGLRHAYIEAVNTVDSDIVILFSPDGNSVPEIIPELVSKAKDGYDMVIVSRYVCGAKSYDDDFITGFGNKMFTFLINTLFRASYTDVLVIFRAIRKDLFSQLDIDKDLSVLEKMFYHRGGAEPLLCIRAAKRKLKCVDIPGDEPARIGGERKLQVIKTGLSLLFMILRELFVWK